MKRIKKGDRVVIINGEYRGSEGVVLQLFPKNATAIVENLNKVKASQKPKDKDNSGGFVEKEAPIPLAKLALMDPKSKAPSKVKYAMNKSNTKVRIGKKSGHEYANGGGK